VDLGGAAAQGDHGGQDCSALSISPRPVQSRLGPERDFQPGAIDQLQDGRTAEHRPRRATTRDRRTHLDLGEQRDGHLPLPAPARKRHRLELHAPAELGLGQPASRELPRRIAAAAAACTAYSWGMLPSPESIRPPSLRHHVQVERLPFGQKESHRWLAAYQVANDIGALSPGTRAS
jgi:hypothetical protein